MNTKHTCPVCRQDTSEDVEFNVIPLGANAVLMLYNRTNVLCKMLAEEEKKSARLAVEEQIRRNVETLVNSINQMT